MSSPAMACGLNGWDASSTTCTCALRSSWGCDGGAQRSVRDERRVELATFRERVFPLLSGEERRTFGARFDRFVDEDDNWTFATCLVHADLGPEHVLVHPNGDLAGVIDWEEATIGDPAWDFAYLVHALPGPRRTCARGLRGAARRGLPRADAVQLSADAVA